MTTKTEIRERYCTGLNILPRHLHGGISRYMERGIRPGDFLLCLFEGRLDEAWLRADGVNQHFKKELGVFLSDYLPLECHNTPEKVAAWMKGRGLEGAQLSEGEQSDGEPNF